MILYAETNFLLEVAFTLASRGSVLLVIPAFSIAEARGTWDRRLSERNILIQDQLQPLIRQLSRSQEFAKLPETSKDLLSAIRDELSAYGCKVLVNFTDAEGYVESIVRSAEH